MKKIAVLALVSLMAISCQQEKTAFVDNEKLIEEYQERKDQQKIYESKMEALYKKRDSIGAEIQKEVKAFQEKNGKLPMAKQQELYAPIQQKSQYFSNLLQQEEQQISKASQVAIDSLLKKVDDEISEYGNANGYAYIFGKNKVGSVMHGAEKNDITQTILDLLNKKYEESK